MTRITGMLVGTLLMLGFFLLALSAGDTPTLVGEVVNSEADASHTHTGPAPAPAPAPAPVKEGPAETSVGKPGLAVTDTAVVAGASPPGAGDTESVLDPQLWNQSISEREPGNHADAAALHYRVWSAFRSEWAANGFARRLALATEVPVEVVNESPGNYQVVFSYRDDEERQALVERIESITGLELE